MNRGMTPKKKVNFAPPFQFSVGTLDIMRIMEREDEWMVTGIIPASIPDEVGDDKFTRVMSGNIANFSTRVSLKEIADKAGVQEGEVRSTLTIEQVENHIIDIATEKFRSKMGVQAS